MRISRGVGQVAMVTVCVLVLLGFVLVVAYGIGHGLVSIVGGLAGDGDQ